MATEAVGILGAVSSDYVELVRRAAEAVSRGDADALIGMCTDDVLLLPGRSVLQGGYRGPAGVREFLAENAETYEVFSVTPDETHDAGDQVVAIGRITVRLRTGGPEATAPAAFVFTFEEGRIARAEDFRDRGTALAAVGLSE